MCGRISRDVTVEALIEMYERGELGIHPDDVIRRMPGPGDPFADVARVQVAPTRPMIITTRETAFESARCGFCPKWFERIDQYGRPLINARGETAASKRTFAPRSPPAASAWSGRPAGSSG